MMELVKATSCTSCGSTDIRDKRKYVRRIRTLHGVEKVEVTQHCCRSCGKTFTDEIQGARHNAQIADEVKEKMVERYLKGPDLNEVKEVMEEFGVKVSTSTIWRAVNATAVATTTWYEQLIGRIPPPRYLCIDEKYIPVHGKKRPNQLFVDPETTIGYKQKLLRNRTEAGIYRELKLLKKRGNLEVIITDDWKSYAPAIKRLGLRHQKCIFHAKRAFRRAMKRARIQKKRKQKFVRWADCFLDSKNINEAKKWLRVLGRTKKEKKLQRFMKSFLFDWKDYFTYLEFDDCPKTTNAAEQHNRLFEQKRQTMHGFRNERSAKLFTKLFSVYSLFRKFEEGKYKGLCPLEIAKVQLPQMDMFALLQ